MTFCHKWDAKNDFAYVLQFFSLISDGLGSVCWYDRLIEQVSDVPSIILFSPSSKSLKVYFQSYTYNMQQGLMDSISVKLDRRTSRMQYVKGIKHIGT